MSQENRNGLLYKGEKKQVLENYIKSRICLHCFDNFANQKDFEKLVKSCNLCQRGLVSKPQVPFIGNPDPKIVFVGRTPGLVNDAIGSLLREDTSLGNLFDSYLKALGIFLSDIYLTNAVFCNGRDNSEPVSIQINRCSILHTYEFHALLKPTDIILMGNAANKMFFGQSYKNVIQTNGYVHKVNFKYSTFNYTANVLTLLHPGFTIRDRGYRQVALSLLKEYKEKYLYKVGK